MRQPEDDAARAWSFVQASWAFGLLVLASVLLALWGAFLVPFRVGATSVPVSWVVAVIGNLAVSRTGVRICGTAGAVVLGAVWLAVVVALSWPRAEGDLLVPGGLVGQVFLLAGVAASAAGCAWAVLAPRSPSARPGSSPSPR